MVWDFLMGAVHHPHPSRQYAAINLKGIQTTFGSYPGIAFEQWSRLCQVHMQPDTWLPERGVDGLRGAVPHPSRTCVEKQKNMIVTLSMTIATFQHHECHHNTSHKRPIHHSICH